MDKGYDSVEIHRLIHENLQADPGIPTRSWNNEIIGCTYRQELAQQSEDEKNGRRQLVEKKILCTEKSSVAIVRQEDF